MRSIHRTYNKKNERADFFLRISYVPSGMAAIGTVYLAGE